MNLGRGAVPGRPATQSKPMTFRRAQPKVNRNDPCPCGSSKKYKKCCMVKDQAAAPL
jgi:uncharacterized protein YecA (UPF0149 family)